MSVLKATKGKRNTGFELVITNFKLKENTQNRLLFDFFPLSLIIA